MSGPDPIWYEPPRRRGRPKGSRNKSKLTQARVDRLRARELEDMLRLSRELGRLEAERAALQREFERLVAMTEDEFLAEEALKATIAARQAADDRRPGCGCCG